MQNGLEVYNKERHLKLIKKGYNKEKGELQMGTHGEASKEYKFKMMRLHYEEGIPIKVLSQRFNIPQATLYGWRKQYNQYGENAFVGCGKQRPDDAELRRLKRENEQLKLQVELLKKVAAYQAKLESSKNSKSSKHK